jgi:hypothetical protein
MKGNAGNQILWSSYPSDVRKWISRQGSACRKRRFFGCFV